MRAAVATTVSTMQTITRASGPLLWISGLSRFASVPYGGNDAGLSKMSCVAADTMLIESGIQLFSYIGVARHWWA